MILIDKYNDYLRKKEIDELNIIRDSVDKLHPIRRETTESQRFWNYFWHHWNFFKIKEACKQAYTDMAQDKEIAMSHTLSFFKPSFTFNFETAVSRDVGSFVSLLDFVSHNSDALRFISESEHYHQIQYLCDFSTDFDLTAEEDVERRIKEAAQQDLKKRLRAQAKQNQ